METTKKKKLNSARVIAINIFMGFSVLIIVAVVLLIAMGYSFTQDGNIEQSGLVQINSTPTGATVTIDGSEQFSRTNMSKMLHSGTHRIVVSKDEYDTWEKDLTVEAGLLTRLDWIRLFPLNPVIETVHQYDTPLRLASASPNHQFLLILPQNTNSAQLINIQNDDISYRTIDFSSILTTTTEPGTILEGDIDIIQWNQNNDKILLTWQNNDSKQWYLVDIKTPANSVNLSAKFSLDFTTILPASDSADKLWALENRNLRLINLKDSTISSILVDNISQLTNYLTTVAYLRENIDPETNQNFQSINIYKEGESSDQIIRRLEDDITDVQITLGNYWGDECIAYTLNNRLYLQIGSFPSAGKGSSSLKTIAEHDLSFTPNTISSSPTDRIVALVKDTQIATYDIELTSLAEFTFNTAQKQTNWLDDFLLWEISDQNLIVYDFDGDNQRSITQASPNSFAALTENDHWIYYLDDTSNTATDASDTSEPSDSPNITLYRLRL